jgi:hypothetical protein
MVGYPQILIPRDFLERAEEFYQAYRDLPITPPPSWPRYFMLCHSIELALKAYLTARGYSPTELRGEFGHDLTRLLTEAVSAGLPLGVLSRSEIEPLDEAHRKFWARYPNEIGKPVFVIDGFETYARELLLHVANFIRGKW